MTPRAKRIAIVFWDGHLGVAPSLIAAFDVLATHGYVVDIIRRDQASALNYPPPPAFEPACGRVITMPRAEPGAWDVSWEESMLATRVMILPLKLAKRVFDHVDRVRFRSFVASRADEYRYDAIIAVDDDGLLASAGVARRDGIPLILWSLEIGVLALGRWDPLQRYFHRRAGELRRHVALTIVQDAAREEALGALDTGAVAHVPNSPAGEGAPHKRYLLHDRLQLPHSQRVILHAGVAYPGTILEKFAAEAAAWPPDWTLVVHDIGRNETRKGRSDFLERLERLGSGRVRISSEPLPYRELDDLFGSADVCAALYSASHGDNWRLISRASGKIAHALRVGVPIICSPLPDLIQLTTDHGCGIALTELRGSADAIGAILADRDGYRERALACYREVFEFGRHFEAVLATIDRLIAENADTSRKPVLRADHSAK